MDSKSKPKVSICIPTYNNPNGVRKLLHSIENQTFRDFDVIITDDYPDDQVAFLISEFENKFQLRYIPNTKPLGPARNWNCSISHATGSLVKIMHHDDYFTTSTSLEEFIDLMDKNPTAAMGFSGSANVDEAGALKYNISIADNQIKLLKKDPTVLLSGNFIGAPSAVIIRNGTSITYDENLRWLVDLEYYISILGKFENGFAYTKKPLVSITVGNKNQLTSSCENNQHLEFFEYGYVYSKIAKSTGRSLYGYLQTWQLLRKYGRPQKGTIESLQFTEPFKSDYKKIELCDRLVRKFEHLYILFWHFTNPVVIVRFLSKRTLFYILNLFCPINSKLK